MQDEEERLLRSVALKNANTILAARLKAEEELVQAKEALEAKTRELAQSLSLVRATLEATNDAILVTDHQGRVCDFNERFVKMWELPADVLATKQHKKILELTSKLFADPAAFVARIDQIYASRESTFDELQLSNGRIIERSSKLQIVNGEPHGRVWSFRDTTEHRLAATAIANSHERFVDIVNQSPVGMVLVDSELRLRHANPRAEPALPSLEQFIGRPLSEMLNEIWPPETANEQFACFRHTLETGEPYFSPLFSDTRKDRGVREWYDWQLHRITLPEGGRGVVCYFVEISAYVKAQEDLRESEERWRATFNQAAVGMAVATLDGHFQQVNHRFCEIMGYSAEELPGRTFIDLTHPDDLPQTEFNVGRLLSGEVRHFSYEKRFIRKDSSVVWSLATVALLRDAAGNPQEFIGVVEDISDQKNAEQAIKEAADRLQLALEAAHLGDWSWDAATDLVTLGRRAAEIFDVPLGERITWAELRERLHPNDRDRARLAVEAALRERADYDIEYRSLRSDNTTRWIAAKGRGVYGPDGHVLGMIGVVQDVTDSKEAEELRYRLAAVVASSDDAIVTKTLDGVIATWNAGAERTFGYSAEEAIGRHVTMLFPRDRYHEEEVILGKLKRGERVDHYETQRIRKDGTHIDVSLTVSPVRNAMGEIVGASKIARDITLQKRTQEAIRQSENELRTMADSIPQLAWMANPEGHIFWYNRRWYEYTGTSFDEMQGWGWQSVHDPEVLPVVIERWKHSLATGEPFEMEFPLRRSDGVFHWFLTRVNPLRDDQGEIVRWFGTNTDVDQVKQVERALRDETRTLELLNNSGTVIGSTLDLQQLLQAVTDAATELSGAAFGAFFYTTTDQSGGVFLLYTLSGAPREAFEKFGHPRATPLFGPTFKGDRPVRSDDILKDPRYGQWGPHHGMPKGHLPVRSYLAVPVISRTEEVIGGLFFGHPETGVFSERTERLIVGIAAQAAVAVDNARLYEGLKRAAEEREVLLEAERAARSEAERMSVMKDEFLATLSHELRTPLNAILGWSQLLGMEKLSKEDFVQGIDAIQRNARAQTQLIEDLLDMSRIVSGKVRLDVQWTDLASVVDAAVDSVRPSADAKGIRLRKILDPHAGPVSGDPTRLQQVFWNLLNNAIKFTPKGGKVDVLLERVNSHLEITVHDSGIGIKPEFLPIIFERFRQVDASTTRSYGGLGLGLSIVKNLVELHGGTVRAKSSGEGEGATFIVSLPLAPVRNGEDRQHPASPKGPPPEFRQLDLSGIKVLVVDDEPDARALISRVLEQCQAEISTAASANEALEKLASYRPHLVISDIGMPGKDGYELLREIRALPADRGGQTPAIALTAFARSEDRTRAMMAGYQVHISKPIEPHELVATVGNLVGRINSTSPTKTLTTTSG